MNANISSRAIFSLTTQLHLNNARSAFMLTILKFNFDALLKLDCRLNIDFFELILDFFFQVLIFFQHDGNNCYRLLKNSKRN